MKINGREVGFKRSVGAIAELTKIAPNGRLDRLGEVFSTENLGSTLENGAKFLASMNKWYEKSLALENKDYVPDPLPEEWFMALDYEDYVAIMEEATRKFQEDDKTTVEAVEPKGVKKNE